MITLEITVVQQELIHAALEHAQREFKSNMAYPEADMLETLINEVKPILPYDDPFKT